MKTNKLTIATTSLVGITACTGLVLMSSYASADDVVDDISITVPTSCTMSGSGMNTHSAEVANGTYRADIGTTTINVLCNDYAGFSIYATGFSGETIGQTNSNKLVGTSASSNATIDTGTATSAGNPDTSNWAMKLATNSQATYPITLTTGYDAYHAVPNEYTKVATREAGTDVGQSATGASLTTTYAAYISKTQAADTYSGKVKYTLVHPYNDPAPSVDVSFDSAYAAAGKTKLNNYYKMQDMFSAICSAVTLEDDASETILIDSRDNKTYAVSKLKDGNCWMTQNLDHDIDSTITYTPADTDIPANWTPDVSTYSTGTTTWEYSDVTPESYDPGTLYWNGAAGYYTTEAGCTSAGGTWNSDYSACNLISSTGNSHYHLGNYYNWTAAIAMNDSNDYDTEYQDANQSICPAGWTLPKDGDNTSSGSFLYLVNQYGWDDSSYEITNPNIWNTAIKATLSGVWVGSMADVGGFGEFWSSAVEGSDNAYGLNAGSSGSVGPDYYVYRYNGYSVRCIAR